MADQRDVRRIAMALPGAVGSEDRFAFSVLNKGKMKGFVWEWNERVQPKKPKVPNPKVLAVRVQNEDEKQRLLDSDERKFFTEPHYNGYPVLVRLERVAVKELRELIAEAYRCAAPSESRRS
jgi:hypothetical protein